MESKQSKSRENPGKSGTLRTAKLTTSTNSLPARARVYIASRHPPHGTNGTERGSVAKDPYKEGTRRPFGRANHETELSARVAWMGVERERAAATWAGSA